MNIEPENVIYAFDLFGTVIFALTGAVVGVRHKLDILGVIVLSCTVGCGGGIIRDSIIGATPATALSNETYLILCVITAVIVFTQTRRILKKMNIITYCDAIGLGVFTAIGAAKAMLLDLSPVGVILAGVITACGGGIIRDIMVNTVPTVLKTDFYATASLIGGLIYYLMAINTDLPQPILFFVTAAFVTGIRLLAFHYKIQLPVVGTHPDTHESKND